MGVLGRRWRKRRLKKANGKRALEGLLGDVGKNQAKRTARLVEASRSYVLQSLTRRSWPRRGWVRCSTWQGGKASWTRRRRQRRTWASKISFAKITKLTTKAGRIKRRMTGRGGEAEIEDLMVPQARLLRRRTTSQPLTWSILMTM